MASNEDNYESIRNNDAADAAVDVEIEEEQVFAPVVLEGEAEEVIDKLMDAYQIEALDEALLTEQARIANENNMPNEEVEVEDEQSEYGDVEEAELAMLDKQIEAEEAQTAALAAEQARAARQSEIKQKQAKLAALRQSTIITPIVSPALKKKLLSEKLAAKAASSPLTLSPSPLTPDWSKIRADLESKSAARTLEAHTGGKPSAGKGGKGQAINPAVPQNQFSEEWDMYKYMAAVAMDLTEIQQRAAIPNDIVAEWKRSGYVKRQSSSNISIPYPDPPICGCGTMMVCTRTSPVGKANELHHCQPKFSCAVKCSGKGSFHWAGVQVADDMALLANEAELNAFLMARMEMLDALFGGEAYFQQQLHRNRASSSDSHAKGGGSFRERMGSKGGGGTRGCGKGGGGAAGSAPSGKGAPGGKGAGKQQKPYDRPRKN